MIQLEEIRRIAEWLAEQCCDDETLFSDMMEGESNVFDMLEQVYARLAADQEIIAGIKLRVTALNERRQRLEQRVEANRSAIGKILRAAKLKNAELIEATVSVRDGKGKLVILDPDAVPTEYNRTKTEPDKLKINEAFADADTMPNWLSRAAPEDVITIRGK